MTILSTQDGAGTSFMPMFMRPPRLFKPGNIANVQIEIQIVDTHEVLEAPVAIGLRAVEHLLNRTLLFQIPNQVRVN